MSALKSFGWWVVGGGCTYDYSVSLSPTLWIMTFDLDLDLDLGLTIRHTNHFTHSVTSENANYFKLPWFSTFIRGDWILVQKWILFEDYKLRQNSPHLGWIWVKDWAYKLNFEGFMVKNFYDNHIWSHCNTHESLTSQSK